MSEKSRMQAESGAVGGSENGNANEDNHSDTDSVINKTTIQELRLTIRRNFQDTVSYIQSKEKNIETEQVMITKSRDKAIEDVNVCFDKIINIINRRKQLLISEVKGTAEKLLEDLEENQETLTFSLLCLSTLKKHSDIIVCESRDDIMDERARTICHEIDKQRQAVKNISLEKGFIDFDDSYDVKSVQKVMTTVGKIKRDHCLPCGANIKDKHTLLPLESSVTFVVLDSQDDRVTHEKIRNNITVQIIDNEQDLVDCELRYEENAFRAIFTPRIPGEYEFKVMAFNHVINCDSFFVDNIKPVKTISKENIFDNLNAIQVMSDQLYMTDSEAGILYCYDTTNDTVTNVDFGKLANAICIDLAKGPEENSLICTLSKRPDDNSGDACMEDYSLLDVKVERIRHQHVTLILIHKHAYVTLSPDLDLMLSDPNTKAISKYDLEGRFKTVISCDELSCPAFCCCSLDGKVILPDIGNDVLFTVAADGSIMEEFGMTGSRKGQLSLPMGVDCDPLGNVIVADTGNKRLQLFSSTGQFISMVTADALDSHEFCPWDVSVTNDGHVWVIEKSSHTLKLFKYM